MTPRSEAEFEKARSESKGRIVKAALELFAKKGFTSTTVEAIATKAGVAKGLIYNYFTTKEDLLYRAFLSWFDEFDNAFSELQSIEDPIQLVELFIEGMFEIFGKQIEMWRLQVGIFMNPEVPEGIRETILKKLREYCTFIRELFVRCGIKDAEGEAWVFASSMDGVMLYYLFMGDRMPVDECKNVLKKRYRSLLERSCGKDIQ